MRNNTKYGAVLCTETSFIGIMCLPHIITFVALCCSPKVAFYKNAYQNEYLFKKKFLFAVTRYTEVMSICLNLLQRLNVICWLEEN